MTTQNTATSLHQKIINKIPRNIKLKIFLILTIIVSTIIMDQGIKYTIIEMYFNQAELNLNFTKQCMKKVIEKDEKPLTEKNIIKALNICGDGNLIGGKLNESTGSQFLINLITKKIVWNNDLYSNKENLSILKQDIFTGYPGKAYWHHNDYTDYLIWTIFPNSYKDINNIPRSVYNSLENKNNFKQYILVQSFKEKEIFNQYKYLRILLFSVSFFIIFIILIKIKIEERLLKEAEMNCATCDYRNFYNENKNKIKQQ